MSDQPVIHTDTGTKVFFDGYSGGASQAGFLGQLTLRIERPGEPETRRRYVAIDHKPLTYEEMRPFNGGLVKHAIHELSLRSDKEDPEMKVMYNAIINSIRVFAAAGFSGGFFGYAQATLAKLLDREPLSPLTGNEDEWDYDLPADDNINPDRRIVAMNKRSHRVMKRADGSVFDMEGIGVRAWDDGESVRYRLREIDSFPYVPETLWMTENPPLEVRFPHEVEAKAIYDGWKDQKGWIPWVDYGNATKQDEARRLTAQKKEQTNG